MIHTTVDEYDDTSGLVRKQCSNNLSDTRSTTSSTTLSQKATQPRAETETLTSTDSNNNIIKSRSRTKGHDSRKCPHKQPSTGDVCTTPSNSTTTATGKTLRRTAHVMSHVDPTEPSITRQGSQFEDSPGAIPTSTVTTKSGRQASQVMIQRR